MTRAYTPHYGLIKPAFNQDPWGDDLNGNASNIDALIYNSLQVSGVVGLWDNDVDYTIGDRAIDPDGGQIWTALIDHTSSATGDFSTDRASYPTYWVAATLALTPRGQWLNDTHYSENDIVFDTVEGVSAICRVTHTSNHAGDIRDDVANWTFIIDLAAGTVNADDVPYSNGASGLTATDAQAAIDEIVVSLNLKAPKAGPTFTGIVTIPTAAVGTNTTQAASTAYVIAQIAALQLLTNRTVRLKSTANVVIASALENGDTIDGVVLATNDLVLLASQTDPIQNGVYKVPASGAASRDTGYDAWNELVGIVFNVTAGSAGAGTSWRSLINTDEGVIGVNAITFNQFGSALTLPMPIASGGTGTTTASAAFDALKQVATTSATGVVEEAITAEVWTGTEDKFPDAEALVSSGDYVAVADGATITLDLDTGRNFVLETIGGNRSLLFSNYTNKIGQCGFFLVKQDGTGNRTLASTNAMFVNANATDIALSTTAAATDLIAWHITKMGGVAKVFLSIAKALG